MSVLDTLLLAHLSIVCHLLTRNRFSGEGTQTLIITLIPALLFGLLPFLKLFKMIKNTATIRQYMFGCCQRKQIAILSKYMFMHAFKSIFYYSDSCFTAMFYFHHAICRLVLLSSSISVIDILWLIGNVVKYYHLRWTLVHEQPLASAFLGIFVY